jgi:hypothetical protein
MWSPKYGCAVVLTACLAAPAAAQVIQEGPSNRFDASFETSREPIFARPDVSSLLPAAELMVPDESAPAETQVTTADAAPAPEVPAPLAAGARTVTTLVKELVISPAESAPAAAPPPQKVAAAPVDPPAIAPGAAPLAEEPAQAQATGTLATGPMPPVRTGRRLAVTRAAWYQHSGRTASGAGLSHLAEQVEEVLIVPSGLFDLRSYGGFLGVGAQEVEGEASQEGDVLGRVVLARPRPILRACTGEISLERAK